MGLSPFKERVAINMSTYFPFGISPSSVTTINYAVTATTASAASTSAISATTTLHAVSTSTTPPAGAAGIDAVCSPSLAPTGPAGATGATGAQGASLTSCPPGTIECVSLSKPGYAKVCIEYGACNPAYYTCPGSI